MTYTIAICDDDPIQVKIIKSYIHKYVNSSNSNEEDDYIIIAEDNCKRLLDKIKYHSVDIFFLDIQMNDMNGIDISIKIKKRYKDSIIVFITGFEKYALKAFEIRAFNYIMKPLTYDKFKTTFDEVCTAVKDIHYINNSEEEFMVNNKLGINKIKYRDIFYFEKNLRKIKIVCKNQNIEYYSSFRELKNNINMAFFTQCHQSFIVNNDKISSYEKQLIYIEELNFYIPVSRSYIEVVKNILTENLFK
ncbi:response regulator transcription factor [Clostridium botulinum]|nr:response regulator transcription factor [Clostridium botulinum]